MARSMTGFGRGSASSEGLSITVEVKTVNHKHLNIYVNGSKSYPELESALRSLLTQAFDRGSVQAAINVERGGALRPYLEVDTELVRGYREALERLEAELGDAPGPKLPIVAALPGVLNLREPSLDPALLERLLATATQQAVAAANELRAREGKTLSDELRSRVQTFRGLVRQVEPLGKGAAAQQRVRLIERVRELLCGTQVQPSEERLELEIALLADRCDVSEEVERIGSHLEQLEWLLGLEEPVGRRLDFLCQELARECNTIGSKSQDAALARLVIEMRAENERLREQVQNLE
jgi:uncharacterized protein (TIGR00255 family)